MNSSKIAKLLNAVHVGNSVSLIRATSMSNVDKGCVTYAKKMDNEFLLKCNGLSDVLVIASSEYKGKLTCPHIISDNPRLDFIKAIKEFFVVEAANNGIHKSAIVEKGSCIGKDVTVGANSFIGPEVVIGDETKIHHNVVIVGRVTIGKQCIIKSGAVIGEEGFGFEYDENKEPLHFPHVGEINIGDNVFIGSNSTIERATLDKTTICNNVKIDDLVQVGHNCTINENTMIMAGSIICGGVIIGKNCWIAPNVSIKQKLQIGDDAYIGLGSVVIRDVADKLIVAGVPAKELNRG